MTTTTLTTATIATFDRAALRTAYRALCTEQGVAVDRSLLDKATALRVAIDAMLTAAAEQQVADERAAAEAARVAAEAEAAAAALSAAELLAQVEAQVAAATRTTTRTRKAATGDTTTRTRSSVGDFATELRSLAVYSITVLTVADRLAMGLPNSAVVHRAYWAPCNPGGKAAALAGLTVRSAKSEDGFDVVLVRAA